MAVALVIARTRFQCSSCCFSSDCTQEYKQSLLCEPRIRSGWFPGHQTPRANRQSREYHFALKGTRQTFAFNFNFYVSFADEVAVWLQIHAAEASLCCLRSQVSVLQNSIPFLIAELFRDFKNCVSFVTWLCLRFSKRILTILELS